MINTLRETKIRNLQTRHRDTETTDLITSFKCTLESGVPLMFTTPKITEVNNNKIKLKIQ